MSQPDQAPLPPATPQPAPGGWPGYSVPPGYPAYPQGGYYPYPYYPTPGYAPPGYNPYPYTLAPGPKRDTYRLVIGIIATVLISVTILIGLLVTFVLGVFTPSNRGSIDQDLPQLVLFAYVALFAAAGGGVGLYFTIRALLGRPSAELRLPTFWLPLGLTALVLGVSVVLHDLNAPVGGALTETPLVLLSGILPALAIFSFTNERLGAPTTWRRGWLAFLSGAFLATLLAIILEGIASILLVTILRVDAGVINNLNGTSPQDLIAMFLILSVVAPLAEEGFKPLGPLLIIGRLSGPAEAFLLGMASGIGFDTFETIGYISQGQNDWIIIAVERIGAGLLHGVGAGMGTLGWYYLIRGKGTPQRWLRGFGALAYAVMQHGLFNGANFLTLVPGPIGNAMQAPVWFLGLPETGQIYLFVILYAAIIGVLFKITAYLRRQPKAPPHTQSNPAPPAYAPGAPIPGGAV